MSELQIGNSALPPRFWSKVIRKGDCWEWTGAASEDGYGRIAWDGRNRRAHVVAYEVLSGPVPEGLQLDHLCRNRLCVNPAHLEPVTCAVNVARGLTGAHHRDKTHCPADHRYPDPNSRGDRQCKECNREAARRYRARLKERGALCPT